MILTAAAAHAAWWTTSAPGWLAFRRALERPEAAQRGALMEYLRRNQETAYGRSVGFPRIRSAREYQETVPVVTYDDLLPWIERIRRGEGGVLTASPVRRLEWSAGSTSAAKRIPYTSELRREFGRGLAPWVFPLFRSDPGLLGGPAYWSVTPAARVDDSVGSAIPSGFGEDTEYLAGPLKRMMNASLAVPGWVRLLRDVETFRYVTAALLLRCRALRMVSVWHPSFLALLTDAVRRHWEHLVEDVRDGTLRPPGEFAGTPAEILRSGLRPDRVRAAELARLGPEPPGRLWPELRLISCWGDAHASLSLHGILGEFPGVRVEPKGLLATEAFVSLPWPRGHVLAVRSHFFEFLDERGEARLAHEVETGGRYSVVVTTGGGLYRYRLEDLVEITGFAEGTPMLRFLGKEGHVCDLRGEKLHSGFVGQVLGTVLAGRSAGFALLAPDPEGELVRYTLYVEAPERALAGLSRALEESLRENPHYRYCAELGQLAPARIFRVEGGGYEAYARRCVDAGQRLGDVKPLPLSIRDGWSRFFRGRFEDSAGDSITGKCRSEERT